MYICSVAHARTHTHTYTHIHIPARNSVRRFFLSQYRFWITSFLISLPWNMRSQQSSRERVSCTYMCADIQKGIHLRICSLGHGVRVDDGRRGSCIVHTYMHTFFHTHMYVYIHVYTQTCVLYIYTYIHTYTHTKICVSCLYIHTYIHIYIRAGAYVQTYTQTCIQTNIHTHTCLQMYVCTQIDK